MEPLDDLQNNIFLRRPLNWEAVHSYLVENPEAINHPRILGIIRRRLECDGCPLCIQLRLINLYPTLLAFSLFLCATRFQEHSAELIRNILTAIETYPVEQMNYCIEKFHGDATKPKTADTVIGEAMTLLFSFFDDFVATPRSGNLAAIQLVRHRYPDSILYVDAHDFTPLHGVCCALNIDIFRYFIEWHLERAPSGRGGLYVMNDSGITSLDTLIDTHEDITNVLTWLQNRGLLGSLDVDEWLLVHRSAHSSSSSTVRFFLRLLPGGALSKDDDGNLPIHLHLGLRYRAGKDSFSQQDFDITRLLIRYGIRNGGMSTIGGLFHPDPDNNKCCTLASLLAEAGEGNGERIWKIIDDCLEEVGDYERAPILHAAIRNKDHISNQIFTKIVSRYGAERRDENGLLPLWYATKMGRTWNDCVKLVSHRNQLALYEKDPETGLPMLAFVGANPKADRGTIYELTKMSLSLFYV